MIKSENLTFPMYMFLSEIIAMADIDAKIKAQGFQLFQHIIFRYTNGFLGGALWPLTYCFFLKTSYRGEIYKVFCLEFRLF